MKGGVDLLDDLLQLEVSILRRQLELEQEAIEFVDAEHDGQPFCDKVIDQLLGGRPDALDSVNDE